LRPTSIRQTARPHRPALNLLELLSAHRVPDASLTVLVTFVAAVSLAPYLGGRSLWILGGSSVTIPTLAESQYWIFVTLAPFLWLLLLGRLFGASRARLFLSIVATAAASIAMATMLSTWPTLGLTAVDSSYIFERELKAWYLTAGHEPPPVDRYQYFRTEPFGLDVGTGCALRVEQIEVSANGRAAVERVTSGFDFRVFMGTTTLLPSTFKGHKAKNNFDVPAATAEAILRSEPVAASVSGRAVVRIDRKVLEAAGPELGINLLFDFVNKITKALPAEYAKKTMERADMVVRGDSGPIMLQFTGWTLYGQKVSLTLNDPVIRVAGKQHCSLAALFR
jgi:hypothetical protein